MALVHEEQEVLGDEIQQRVGRRAWLTACEVAAIVLDALTEPHLAHHLQIIVRPLPDALRLQELPLPLKLRHPLIRLRADGLERRLQFPRRGDELLSRIKRERLHLFRAVPRQRIEQTDAVYLIAKELHAHAFILQRGRPDLHHIATRTELPALKIYVVPLIHHLHQSCQEMIAIHRIALPHGEHGLRIIIRRA